jgi:hypothetical protein
MMELNVISFTTPIIQNRRVSSPGSPALVLLLIKRLGFHRRLRLRVSSLRQAAAVKTIHSVENAKENANAK